MNLAGIVGLLLTFSWLLPGANGFAWPQAGAGQSESSPQTVQSQPQSSETASPSPPDNKKVDTTIPPKPSLQPHRRHKKKNLANCVTSAASLNSGSGSFADPATDSAMPDSAKAGSATLPPCPPPKKVIRNGGSEEPTIQLIGGTPAQQASNQRSTEQLTAATQENLKKIAQRQLTPSQQEMVNQIKQFMDQSKTAVTAGDAERGHNLAQKAHLLSEELLKP